MLVHLPCPLHSPSHPIHWKNIICSVSVLEIYVHAAIAPCFRNWWRISDDDILCTLKQFIILKHFVIVHRPMDTFSLLVSVFVRLFPFCARLLCTCIFICTCLCVYLLFVYLHFYLHVCYIVCIWVCLCVFWLVCMFVFVCMFVCLYTYLYACRDASLSLFNISRISQGYKQTYQSEICEGVNSLFWKSVNNGVRNIVLTVLVDSWNKWFPFYKQ